MGDRRAGLGRRNSDGLAGHIGGSGSPIAGMGVTESSALRARQREVAARIDRLIDRADRAGRTDRADRAEDAGRADRQTHYPSNRRDELRAVIRAGSVALRRRTRAIAQVDAATRDAGRSLARLVELGLNNREAFGALGLSAAVGRRLLRMARSAASRTSIRGDL
jgi:hypothetical protein